MLQICRLFGFTRQAHYKNQKKEKRMVMQHTIALELVEEIRANMPRLGTIKLYHMLQESMRQHGIKMGRDKLYDLLNYYGLLIRRKRRRKPLTTDSDHPFFKYKNLIKNLQITYPNQVWVGDITYIRLINGYCYLSWITDAFSRRIVGYFLNKDLASEGTINALRMAIFNCPRKRSEKLIHHSDRGLQYCCREYIQLLNHHNIAISMTQNGDPYENAIAERVNGILKEEFGLFSAFKSLMDAQAAVDHAVRFYNEKRPHFSLNLQTPLQVHQATEIA
ncbi:MAG: IS3 family transposase [Chitinophagaceae bacterium]|nr:IS3 family transposase [Chitinophagaceae bacterium]